MEQFYVWVLSPDCRILQGDFCLQSVGSRRTEPVLGLCKDKSQYQTWRYNVTSQTIKHIYSGLCLDQAGRRSDEFVLIAKCTGSPSQVWEIDNFNSNSQSEC